MTKLDANALLAEAESKGLVFKMKSGWRKAMYFAGVLSCLPIITIPFGIWIFVMARRACVAVADRGFVVRSFTTRAYAYEDVERFTPIGMQMHVHGGGLVGALAGAAVGAVVEAKTQGVKGPIQFKLKGKWMPLQLPAHTVENSVAMVQALEQRSGQTILPPPAPGAVPPSA
ncbi:MAG: hypothetical protein JXB32_12460 [Deltaproteobacteria bacterium]|nr:hypothetical protein [Deltaproteobacteria bacterium]